MEGVKDQVELPECYPGRTPPNKPAIPPTDILSKGQAVKLPNCREMPPSDMGKVGGNRRGKRDRRSQSRPGSRFLLLGGRRKSTRRESEKKEYIFVGQYHPWLLAAIMLLAILSIADGIFTLHLIERGAAEKNPLMAWFLSLGTTPVFTAKFPLTCTELW